MTRHLLTKTQRHPPKPTHVNSFTAIVCPKSASVVTVRCTTTAPFPLLCTSSTCTLVTSRAPVGGCAEGSSMYCSAWRPLETSQPGMNWPRGTVKSAGCAGMVKKVGRGANASSHS